jgi:hypothetical protein
MAAFFANVQVRADDPAVVAAAVDDLLTHAGYAPEAETYGGDRSIYIGPTGDGWVGVYDSACDGISVGPLAWLARGLSAHLDTPTLAWLVHDSAVLIYLLFAGGEVSDRYVSRPDYFQPNGRRDDEPPPGPLGGDGRRLLVVTRVDGDGAAVTRWLRHPSPFVEQTLRRVAAALGQTHADLGHAELEADLLAETSLEDRAAFRRLEFVQSAPDAVDADR